MSDWYVGEIRMFAGHRAPAGWAFCNGQKLPIYDNELLFALIGTTYGGDGQTTFGLPDMRGRTPIHHGTDPESGAAYAIGQSGGTETVSLAIDHLPAHSHTPLAVAASGDEASPSNSTWAQPTKSLYSTNAPDVTMLEGAIRPEGQSVAHDNMMPFLGINFIIALTGVFPSSN